MIDGKFVEGFLKIASPVLTDKTYDMDGSEYERKSQAILEASYDDDDKRHLSKRQQKDGKAVKEESPAKARPYTRIGERNSM